MTEPEPHRCRPERGDRVVHPAPLLRRVDPPAQQDVVVPGETVEVVREMLPPRLGQAEPAEQGAGGVVVGLDLVSRRGVSAECRPPRLLGVGRLRARRGSTGYVLLDAVLETVERSGRNRPGGRHPGRDGLAGAPLLRGEDPVVARFAGEPHHPAVLARAHDDDVIDGSQVHQLFPRTRRRGRGGVPSPGPARSPTAPPDHLPHRSPGPTTAVRASHRDSCGSERPCIAVCLPGGRTSTAAEDRMLGLVWPRYREE